MNNPSTTQRRVVLVHYGEIALKKGNRACFEDLLIRNIRTALGAGSRPRIDRLSGRLAVEAEGLKENDIALRLSKVFGIANVAVATRLPAEIGAIRLAAITAASAARFSSFAVRARRGEKGFPMNSQEINVDVGAAVGAATGARVDLTRPEFVIGIELLDRTAFVFTDRIAGPGGLPFGSGGAVACLISGGIDSPVASWRMMKRGCRPIFIHFHSAPFTSVQSLDKVGDIVEVLTRFQPECTLITIPFGEIQKKIVTGIPQEYRVVIYRRFMIRIACEAAAAHGAQALVTGEALGQVASQTIENITAIDSVSALPILRPLVGMDKEEIVTTARGIGTYDLSIQPHDDCCSFLTPRHPVTRSSAAELSRVEAALDVDALVKSGIEGADKILIPSRGN